MGKGDRGSRRGKIFRGSYGRTRPHTEKKQPPVKAGPAKKPR